VGAGRIEILEAVAQRLLIQLDMIRPMKAQNTVEFTLAFNGGATEVTLVNEGQSAFHAPIMMAILACSERAPCDWQVPRRRSGMRSALHPDRPGQCARGQPSKRTSFVPGLRGFGDDWPPGLCRPGPHPQYHGVIAAIAYKHTKVTPESPGGSGIPA
jgi:hypothetical protein